MWPSTQDTIMRGAVLILYQLQMLVCHQVSMEKQVPREDVVYELVKQLAGAVEEEGALDIVRDLVGVFRKVGDDRELLARDIWNLLGQLKDKTRTNKRILPIPVVNLLKAKMTINGKKSILEKVLSLVERESLISVKKIDNNDDGLTLQVIWVPPMFQSFPAVDLMGNETKQENQTKDVDGATVYMTDLEITWVPPPSFTDFDKHKDISHNIKQNLEQQDTNKATPSSGMAELTVKTVENQASDSNSIVKQSEKSRQMQSNISDIQTTETLQDDALEEDKANDRNLGKASHYQLYASKLKKKEGSKSGRSRLETGSETGSERDNTDLEDQSGMEYAGIYCIRY